MKNKARTVLIASDGKPSYLTYGSDRNGPRRTYSNGEQSTDSAWSDRLLQWDYDKHNKLCQKHFGNQGQHWGQRSPQKIQEFLADYTGRPLVLCSIDQDKNRATGYPLWHFQWRYTDSK